MFSDSSVIPLSSFRLKQANNVVESTSTVETYRILYDRFEIRYLLEYFSMICSKFEKKTR